MQNLDGMNYAPKGKPKKVVKNGEFVIAAAALDHGHIYGMMNGLVEAGAKIKYVFDNDENKIKQFIKTYKEFDIKVANSIDEILEDKEINLVAGAGIPNLRAPLGIKVMQAGKHYFSDKSPFTSLEQIDDVRKMHNRTGKKYMCYFSERLHVEAAVYAGQLIEQGEIGRVIQVIGMGPHKASINSRPDWFFKKENYGGILTDIGSHQIEQFLYFSGNEDATVVKSQVANYNHKSYPELDDFGDANLVGQNGATNYFRVDWFTPDGLSTWGDGRTFILGTNGFIELRKYTNIGLEDKTGDNVFLVNNQTEKYFNVNGKVGFPFFGDLILDLLNNTENAMTQEHVFKAGELCIKAQLLADVIE